MDPLKFIKVQESSEERGSRERKGVRGREKREGGRRRGERKSEGKGK